MDPLTHGLVSYALKRAAFPRVPPSVTLAILLAGTVADLDALSLHFGPSAFLTWHRTYTHSILAAILISGASTMLFLTASFLKWKLAGVAHREDNGAIGISINLAPVLYASLCAALLHIAMDACQSEGVALLWPFSTRRLALDWVARLDLWILAILLAGLLLPMLTGLVTEEIGVKSKRPRGKLGASLALAAIILYLVLRAALHGNAVAALQSRTYRGESPRRVAAFADSTSPILWYDIVETDRALHLVEVSVALSAAFDPDSALTSYKPEPSPALDAACNTATALRFLQVARFPKATVEKTPEGFHILLRDFPSTRDVASGSPVQALIDTDPSGKILSEDLAWDANSKALWW